MLDIASRANVVTIAVNNAALASVRIKNTLSMRWTYEDQKVAHIRLPLFYHSLVPIFREGHVVVPYGWRMSVLGRVRVTGLVFGV